MSVSMVKGKNTVRKLEIGFLGLGWIGRKRLEALAKTEIVQPVAFVDTCRELASETASFFGAKVYRDLEEMLKYDLDGIVIATPSALHAAQAIKALDAGIPVFCQKPLGRSAQEVSQIVETARRNDLLLGVDLSYRFLNCTKILKTMVNRGELGEIFASELVFHNGYGPDKPWFYDPSQSGGGCLIDLGIHLIDLILWMKEFPVVKNVAGRLYSSGRRLEKSGSVEDYVSASFDLDGGCGVDLSCSWKLHAGADAVISISIYGTKGGVKLSNVSGSFYDFRLEKLEGTKSRVVCEPPDDWGGRAAVDWAQKLYDGEGFDSEVLHTIRVASVMDAIYQSSYRQGV